MPESKNLTFEWITDASGYCFLMPKLTPEMILKYDLGTFDLADFTFGTCNAIFSMYRHVTEFTKLETLLWRIENILRLLEWTLLLKNHSIASMFLSKIRIIVFDIAWKISQIRKIPEGYI